MTADRRPGRRRRRIGVPQPVRAVPQPRPARPPAQPEEPGVRRHLRPLHPRAPARRPPARTLPAPHQRGGNSRRSTTPPGVRTSTAPCRETTTVHPLGDHPPAAVLVGLQHRPRVRLRDTPRPARTTAPARPRPSPRRPHRPRRPAPAAPTGRTGSLRRPAAAPRRAPRPGTRARSALRGAAAPARPPAVRRHADARTAAPAPARPYPIILHRTHQVTPVHAAQPAISGRARGRRSTAVHLRVTLGHLPARGSPSDGRSAVSLGPRTVPTTCRTTSAPPNVGAHPGAEVDHMASSVASRVTRTPHRAVRGDPTHTTRTAREPP